MCSIVIIQCLLVSNYGFQACLRAKQIFLYLTSVIIVELTMSALTLASKASSGSTLSEVPGINCAVGHLQELGLSHQAI